MILPVNDACRWRRTLSNLLLARGTFARYVIYIFRVYSPAATRKLSCARYASVLAIGEPNVKRFTTITLRSLQSLAIRDQVHHRFSSCRFWFLFLRTSSFPACSDARDNEASRWRDAVPSKIKCELVVDLVSRNVVSATSDRYLTEILEAVSSIRHA